MNGPTEGQIESYRCDGFLIVERFLDAADVEHARERFMRVFAHEWETGLASDEVNYVPGSQRWPHAPLGGTSHAPDDWLGHVRDSIPSGVDLELVPIEVPAGGAAFHDGWTFHGSPPNERADAQQRSIISHMISTDTRWNPEHPHPIYSRYRRPSEVELDEAFFPILWRDGYRTPWLAQYAAAGAAA